MCGRILGGHGIRGVRDSVHHTAQWVTAPFVAEMTVPSAAARELRVEL